MNEILNILIKEKSLTVIIIGKTKSGKTVLSNIINESLANSVIYEAGAWARELFVKKYSSFDSLVINDRKLMNDMVLDTLNSNPNHSIDCYNTWFNKNKNKYHILCGFRNPYDVEHIINNYSNILTINIIDPDCKYEELFQHGIEEINNLLFLKSKYYINVNKFNFSIVNNENIPMKRFKDLIDQYNDFEFKIANSRNIQHMKYILDELYYLKKEFNLQLSGSIESHLKTYTWTGK